MRYYFSREPVFNRRMDVEMYSYVLHTAHIDQVIKNYKISRELSKLLLYTIFENQIEKISDGKKAVVYCVTPAMLQLIPRVFTKDQVIVQISRGVLEESDSEELCQRIHGAGFAIILDEFEFKDKYFRLLPYARMVTVEAKYFSEFFSNRVLQKLHAFKKKVLIKNIADKHTFGESLNLGYDLFHGSFFQKPEYISKGKISHQKQEALTLLRDINQKGVTSVKLENELTENFKHQTALFALLNNMNGNARSEISSYKQAILLYGRGEIVRWVSAFLIKEISAGKSQELFREALLRAKFMDSMALALDMEADRKDLYLLGQISFLDVLMNQTIADVLPQVFFSKEINNALSDKKGRYSLIFKFVKAHQNGATAVLDKISEHYHLDNEMVKFMYFDAINWSNQISKLI